MHPYTLHPNTLKKILVIEDDLTINQNIKIALEAEQFEAVSVFDGLLADRMLKKNDFNCVVLDINLPGKNGFDICRDFRKYNTTTPVIILTAFDELDDKVAGFDCGADDYLTKPFYMKELILRIHALLKRNSGNEPQDNAVLVAGDLVIHGNQRRVLRENKEIQLTPREYQILRRLVLAKGELVLKKTLIEEIWGGTFDANTNTIEVYINFLRKKVDKPFGADSIKTKIGYGYYFEER